MSDREAIARTRAKGWYFVAEGTVVALGALSWLYFVFFEPLGALDYIILGSLASIAAWLIWLGRVSLRLARLLEDENDGGI